MLPDAVAGPTAFNTVKAFIDSDKFGSFLKACLLACSTSSGLFTWTSSVNLGRNFPRYKEMKCYHYFLYGPFSIFPTIRQKAYNCCKNHIWLAQVPKWEISTISSGNQILFQGNGLPLWNTSSQLAKSSTRFPAHHVQIDTVWQEWC